MRTAGVIARVWLKGNHSRRAARKEHRKNALETTYVVHHFARKIQAGEKSFLGRIAPAEREKRESTLAAHAGGESRANRVGDACKQSRAHERDQAMTESELSGSIIRHTLP